MRDEWEDKERREIGKLVAEAIRGIGDTGQVVVINNLKVYYASGGGAKVIVEPRGLIGKRAAVEYE